MFNLFRQNALCVIPLRHGFPQIQWIKYQTALPTQEDCNNWAQYDEYAIVCGAVSNVIAFDIDTDDTQRFEMLAGVSPVKKYGTKGFTAFYRYNGEKSQVWQENGHVICEILSDKRLTTLPPSLHRKSKKPYVWLDKDIIGTELPFLNPDIIIYLDAKYKRPISHFKPHTALNESVEYKDAEEMLTYISADCARDEWLHIGMALKDEFGDGAYGLWHKWSEKGSTYKKRDADSVWRSFYGEGVTIATLVFYAKQNGWLRQVERHEYKITPIKKIIKPKEIKAHGLVGEIAGWMTDTAWKPQPILSLSAALVLVGFLKGRKYITETDVYSNIYAFNIAGTSCGKDRPQAAIKHLMSIIGAQDKLLNKPASAVGFIDSMMVAEGHGITTIDEMADYISSANAKGASYKKLVLTNWMEAFTSVRSHMDAERRADAAKEKSKRIHNPHFSLLGSTTSNSLKEALSGGDISSGLLNRFLFFQSKESPRKRKFKEFDHNAQLPITTIERLNCYLDKVPELIKVKFTDEAMMLFDSIDDYYQDESDKLHINDRLRALYGRAHEYVAKIALILCDDQKISKQDIECAHDIVQMSVRNALEFCGDITDTREEKDFIAVRDFIKERKKCLFGDVTYSVRSVKSSRAKEIVDSLIDSGFVHSEVEKTKGRSGFLLSWI